MANAGVRLGASRIRPRPDAATLGRMWLFGLGVAAPVVDTAAGLALGHPLPVTSLAVLALLAARWSSVRRNFATGQ